MSIISFSFVGGRHENKSLLILFAIRFVSENQPLGRKLAIQALIFAIRNPQRPVEALGGLGAEVL